MFRAQMFFEGSLLRVLALQRVSGLGISGTAEGLGFRV